MINLDKYQNEQEFQTALKEMFSSLDESVSFNDAWNYCSLWYLYKLIILNKS